MARSRDSRRLYIEAGISALILLVVIALSSPIAPYVRAIYANVFAQHSVDSTYIGLSRDALIQKLSADNEERTNTKYQSVLYGLLAEENMKLRLLLNASLTPKGILAEVIARPPQSAYDTILISAGNADGIAVNNLVLFEGIVLGKIVSVGDRTASAQLFSSPGNQEDVILGSPRAIAVLNGVGGGAFELSLPKGISVSEGDTVRLSGSGSYLVGIVSSVATKASDSSQTIHVRSPVSYPDLDFVQVLSMKNI